MGLDYLRTLKGENDRRVETIHYMEHLGMDSY